MITRRITRALPLLLLALIPLATTAHAQDVEATATLLGIEELDGVQRAVSRTYATDVADIVAATTDEEAEPDDAGIGEGPLTMMMLVAEFDTGASASSAYDTLGERLQPQVEGASGGEVEAVEIDDLGDAAIQVTSVREGESMLVSAVLVQEGEWLYLAMAVSQDDSAPDAALGAVDYGMRQTAEDGATIYLHTGRSSGGIWNKLPGTGTNAGALNGTQPIYDSQLLPPPENGED